MSNQSTICKSIYVEDGFNGILTAIKMFPERLREEMLEDLSPLLLEWETKLYKEEKEDLVTNLRNKNVVFQKNDINELKIYDGEIEKMSDKLKDLERERENIIKTIEEFPSILPETDIDKISTIDGEIECHGLLIKRLNEEMDNLLDYIGKKEIRRGDDLF